MPGIAELNLSMSGSCINDHHPPNVGMGRTPPGLQPAQGSGVYYLCGRERMQLYVFHERRFVIMIRMLKGLLIAPSREP